MSSKQSRPRARRLLRWFGASATALVVALLLAVMLPGWLYDTDAFPEGHGEVDTALFLSNRESQPLLVGLGGSEG